MIPQLPEALKNISLNPFSSFAKKKKDKLVEIVNPYIPFNLKLEKKKNSENSGNNNTDVLVNSVFNSSMKTEFRITTNLIEHLILKPIKVSSNQTQLSNDAIIKENLLINANKYAATSKYIALIQYNIMNIIYSTLILLFKE